MYINYSFLEIYSFIVNELIPERIFQAILSPVNRNGCNGTSHPTPSTYSESENNNRLRSNLRMMSNSSAVRKSRQTTNQRSLVMMISKLSEENESLLERKTLLDRQKQILEKALSLQTQ